MIYNSKRVRTKWLSLALAIIVIAQLGFIAPREGTAHAADNGLAEKPYMGWSSYSMQVYDGPSGNWISEAKLKEMSDIMHEKLQSHGYNYINIDAGWNGSMDEYGRPVPSEVHYPNGFENLIDYIHNNGQKVGIYLIPGVSPTAVEQDLPIYGAPGCTIGDIAVTPYKYADYWNLGYKIDFSNPCAQKYIDSIADEIAAWGVDFVKFDSVTPGSGHNDESIDARDDVKAWSEALSRHHIWLELSWALDHNYVDFWKQYANGWRVDWDVESYDREVGMTQWANIARLFPDAALWWRDAGPGGWNDFDSLNVGNGATSGLTKDERQTAMTLWAASSAQLYTGDDLSNLDDYGLSLLTNDEVIAVNQAGRPVHPVSTATSQQVWYANNGDGTYTVALFNLGSKGANVSVKWSDIGLTGSASVRDLWSHKELGSYASGYGPVYLEPHASRLFKVTALDGQSRVNDDDTGMRYTGDWTRNGGNELVHDSQDLVVTVSDSASSGQPDSNGENGGGSSGTNDDSNDGEVSVTHSVYINDNDPAIQYSNKWGYSSGRSFGDFDSDVHYGEPDNGTEPEFSYTFEGTGIELFSEQGSSNGKIDIYLDDQFMQTVDSNGGEQSGQYSVYSVSDLTQGEHTLRAVRNPDGQYYFILDALRVETDTLLGEPSATSFDKDLPADIALELPLGGSSLTGIKNGDIALATPQDYTISGNTLTLKKEYLQEQPSGQSTKLDFGFAGGDSQSLSIAVTGTSIAPSSASFDQKSTAQADISVAVTLTDSNSLTAIKNGEEALAEGEDYTYSNGTVTILKSYLAQQPVGLTNLTFEFDLGAARTLAITVINTASPGRYAYVNDDDPAIKYTGSWNRSTGRPFGDYNSDVHYVENNGDFFTYTFNGTGISYITELDQGQGEVDIYIDGSFHGTANTYEENAHNLAQQTVYTVEGLTPGYHTLKAVKKSGQFMLLDALKVQLTELIDISAADFYKEPGEQTDIIIDILGSIDSFNGISNGSYSLVAGNDYSIDGNEVTIKKEYLAAQPVGDTTLTFSFKGDFGDDIHAATDNGDYYSYTFRGKAVELLSPISPKQGEMDVYLDGELQTTVDAYSATRGVQQSLFQIDGLSSSGTHTIKAVKKSGDVMLADALIFDVVGDSGTSANPPSGNGGTGGTGNGVTIPTGELNVVHSTGPDGTDQYEVNPSSGEMKSLIDKQKASGAKSVVVAIPDKGDGKSLTNVTLDTESLAQLADSGLAIDINTAKAKLFIPNGSLHDLGDDIYFHISGVASGDQSSELEQRANGTAVITAAAGGKEVTLIGQPMKIESNLQNREVTLVLPLGEIELSDAELDQLGVYIEHSDGTKEFKKGDITSFDGSQGIRFTINKFSTFAVFKAEGQVSKFPHESYIEGYEGGLFKPENTITRAEIATILSRVVNRDASSDSGIYSDVASQYWAAEAIAAVTKMDLMQGYEDGSFRPEQAVTRAEMAAIAVGFGLNGAQVGEGFTDIADHWAAEDIQAAQGAGWIQGYMDGSFRPNQTLTRAEAVTIINRVLGRGPLYGIEQSPWADVAKDHWAIRDIEEASVNHSFEARAEGGEMVVD